LINDDGGAEIGPAEANWVALEKAAGSDERAQSNIHQNK